MRVAFYINNRNFQNIDCRNVEYGNPGIGGTWHIFLIVASQLARRNNGIEVTVFIQVKNNNLPLGPTYIEIPTAEEAVLHADKNGLDFIILNYFNTNWINIINLPFKSKIMIIPWCHNFVNRHRDFLNLFATNDRIAKVINVGKEQMDLYLDHPVYDKMEYIYNCIPIVEEFTKKVESIPFSKRKPIVTYIGSLVPEKNFHILAMIWPDILKEIPDAELNVIGTGRLYNQNAKLGSFNIAEESYEKKFMPFLSKNGKVMKGVHFLGNLGIEKNEILMKSKVGVPNPTGLTETFCISAVEMQLCGNTVTAMYAPGYMDTFYKGCLVHNKKELTESIVRLLKSTKEHVGYNIIKQEIISNFSIDNVLNDWENLLQSKCYGRIHPIMPLKNKAFHLKKLKYFIRSHNLIRLLFNKLPNIEFFYWQYERIIRMLRKY